MADDNSWDEVVKGVKPLKNKNIHIDEIKAKEVVIRKDKEVSLPFDVLKKGKGVKKDDLSQMDGSLQKRFKREEFEVEATLDLHGVVEKVAFDKVCNFVKSAYNSGKRCVLIITGKGINDELFGERGVLRKSVPFWRFFIVRRPACHSAQGSRERTSSCGSSESFCKWGKWCSS